MSRVEPNPNDPNFVADYIRGLERRLARLEQSALRGIGNLANPEPWHYVSAPGEPPFAAGWDGGGGGTFPRFYRSADGIVHLRGNPRRASAGGATIFSLPLGYLPGSDRRFGVLVDKGGGVFDITELGVLPTGEVSVSVAVGELVLLDNIAFRIIE